GQRAFDLGGEAEHAAFSVIGNGEGGRLLRQGARRRRNGQDGGDGRAGKKIGGPGHDAYTLMVTVEPSGPLSIVRSPPWRRTMARTKPSPMRWLSWAAGFSSSVAAIPGP